MPNGKPFTILWEYSTQFAEPEFVKLMLDYFRDGGLNVNAKEQTSQATVKTQRRARQTSTWNGTFHSSRH